MIEYLALVMLLAAALRIRRPLPVPYAGNRVQGRTGKTFHRV
jgi:hypothetical protein